MRTGGLQPSGRMLPGNGVPGRRAGVTASVTRSGSPRMSPAFGRRDAMRAFSAHAHVAARVCGSREVRTDEVIDRGLRVPRGLPALRTPLDLARADRAGSGAVPGGRRRARSGGRQRSVIPSGREARSLHRQGRSRKDDDRRRHRRRRRAARAAHAGRLGRRRPQPRRRPREAPLGRPDRARAGPRRDRDRRARRDAAPLGPRSGISWSSCSRTRGSTPSSPRSWRCCRAPKR